MNDHKHIIVVNGRHYDVRTGKNLSHPWEGPVRRAKSEASHRTPRKPVHKPEPAAAHAGDSAAREAARPVPARHRAARNAAGHIAPHRPKAARTLMRQTVKKPSPALKRRIRAQGYLDSQIKPPTVRETAKRSVNHRAPRGKRVHLISHFSPHLFTVTTFVAAEPPAARQLISDRPAAGKDAGPSPTMRTAFAAKPRTTAELLEYAIRYADAPPEAPHRPARKHAKRRVLHRRAHAVAH